jgi:Lrp/AsnC family leucine-responsive transcriptional regulator
MEKIDLKDKKILYHLDLDSRQSFSSIGKKVGLSKDIVSSRVNNLIKKGIIIRFNTLIDDLKLGFTVVRFYFKFQYVTPEIKKEIIDHFVDCKYTEICNEHSGSINLIIFMIARNATDIYSFWQKTLSKYRDYFASQILSLYVGENVYPKSFLIDIKDDRKNLIIKNGGGLVNFDDLDYKILEELALNSRVPTIEIAKKLETSTSDVNNRIKKLKKSNVINRFHITVDWGKLGYRWFKLNLFLREYDKIHELTRYLEQNPHLAYIDKTIGYADLEIELIVDNQHHLQDIIDDLQTKYPGLIRNFSYSFVVKSHKWADIIFE